MWMKQVRHNKWIAKGKRAFREQKSGLISRKRYGYLAQEKCFEKLRMYCNIVRM